MSSSKAEGGGLRAEGRSFTTSSTFFLHNECLISVRQAFVLLKGRGCVLSFPRPFMNPVSNIFMLFLAQSLLKGLGGFSYLELNHASYILTYSTPTFR